MKRFAALIDQIAFTPGLNDKRAILARYFRETPDPDRGFAAAALTGDLKLKTVTPSILRGLAGERIDAELFALSYDYVGDLAETASLIWPGDGDEDIRLGEVVGALASASRSDAPRIVADHLDRLPQGVRYAFIKLALGGFRIGVSARLAKQALADAGGKDVAEIEEIWHGLTPPYRDLFAWLEGGPRPRVDAAAPFRPVMLATPFDAAERARRAPADYAAEWKWDGIRVQAVAERGDRRLYTRTGEDISAAFPDLVEAMAFDGALDGELMVKAGGGDGAFNDLQQRLNRKKPSAKLIAASPAFLRAYDLLIDGAEDVRPLPFETRRARLASFIEPLDDQRFDLSPNVAFAEWDELDALRSDPPHPAIEGLMLKRRDAAYAGGRPKGPWFKWKRDPYLIDAVLMYAQRGHGKRSSFYSDYTFGVWTPEGALTPVGKAYFGFTDAELAEIDKFVRANTVERFGPVRSVAATPEHGLVFEVAFEGLNASKRHKSGVAMRFPRISRLRWDKPPAEADNLEALRALL